MLDKEMEGPIERILDMDFKFTINHVPGTLQHE